MNQIDQTVVINGSGRLIFGDNVRIDAYTTLVVVGSLDIGDNVHIGPHCSIHAGAHIYIDDNAQISSGVKIYSHSDDYGYIDKKYKAPVDIGEGVILGCNVVVLPGVGIAKGVAVGAQSLVSKSCPIPNTVYAGIPAVKVKARE